MTYVIAIQHIGAAALLMQHFFHRMSKGGFACTGQPCKPDDCAAVAVLFLAALTRNGSIVPDDVGRKIQDAIPKDKKV